MPEPGDQLLDDLIRARNNGTGDGGSGLVAPTRSTWAPVDLTAALAGADVPPPAYLARTDGALLLYAGRTHWFQGESESLKSWAAQVAAAQILTAGGRVLVIDFEDEAPGVVGRLLALAVPRQAIADRLTYVHPEEPLMDGPKTTAGGVDFNRLLAGPAYDLVIIDGVTEAMTIEGLELLSNADIAVWLRLVPRRLATTGAAVVAVDHVTKAVEGRGRYAVGGQHKLSGVTGAAYTFSLVRPLTRATERPLTGSVVLHVAKDRPGYIRALAVDGKIGTLELTSWPDGGVTGHLLPASAEEPPPDTKLCRTILEHLALYAGASGRHVEDHLDMPARKARSALRWMAAPERGWITVEAKGRSHLHWLTDTGREQLS